MGKYLLNSILNKEEALELYLNSIKNDARFINDFDIDLITIEEKYNCYGFYKSFIKDLKYYIKDKLNDKVINKVIDMNTEYSSSSFILNELSKDDSSIFNEDVEIYNNDTFSNEYKFFLDKINERINKAIYEINRITPNKNVFTDIEAIKDFENYIEDLYYEKIYVIRFRGNRKNDFVSILSSVNKNFYELDFEKSLDYLEYLKHGRLFMIVPKYYLDFYDYEAFKAFMMAKKMLVHMSKSEILAKVKVNIKNPMNALYSEYLLLGIYYFKIRGYIKKLDINSNNLKERIYLSYLALSYNKAAGMFLYECSKLGLLEDNSIQNQLKLLNKSYSLGSMHAKKNLYLHYSSYLYFDKNKLNKYL